MKAQQQNQSQREVFRKKYDSARSNLLLAIILTVVNIVIFMAGGESMLLFSMSVPYYAVIFGSLFGIEIVGVILAAIGLGLYLLSWGLSKKRSGWLILALVLFILDTLAMVGMYLLMEDVSGTMDALIHAWILYYLITGVSSGKKLKTMPEEAAAELSDGDLGDEDPVEEGLDHSVPMRRIDEDEKCRILLSYEHEGRKIVYRRIKRTNQLVINNYVYDEIEMLVEPAHNLYANVGGHTYEVGFDGSVRSYCKVDEQIVAKKIRWY